MTVSPGFAAAMAAVTVVNCFCFTHGNHGCSAMHTNKCSISVKYAVSFYQFVPGNFFGLRAFR